MVKSLVFTIFLLTLTACGQQSTPEHSTSTISPTNTQIPLTSTATIEPTAIPTEILEDEAEELLPFMETEERVERVIEVPAEDDMSIRLWQPRPENVDEDRKVLAYGITKVPESWYPKYEEGVYTHYLSAVLLESPTLDEKNNILMWRLGIPDYEKKEWVEFTLKQLLTAHEDGDINKPLIYGYTIPPLHGPPGGFNLDWGKSLGVLSMDEALKEIDKAVGRQVAFNIPRGSTPSRLEEYFETTGKNELCHGIQYCIDIMDEIIQAIPESESILDALSSHNPRGYEGKELVVFVGQPIIPTW